MNELLDRITTGDAKLLSKGIPDESVDLILCDPVYDALDDYQWLAQVANRVLKPDRACLVWIANPRIFEVGKAMSNLNFVMPLSYTVMGGTYMLFSRKVFVWNKLCLWYEKGKAKTYGSFTDSIVSGQPTADGFKWNKNPEAMRKWLQAFTLPGDIVFDPFCGSGTVPALCKSLGRHYIAFEIDGERAEQARQRVSYTLPPLVVETPTQVELSYGET